MDGIDKTLMRLLAVEVYYVAGCNFDEWPKGDTEWERTPDGYRVTMTTPIGIRTAELTSAVEIDYAAHSGAALYLRDDWYCYSNGTRPGYEYIYIPGDPTARTPFAE